MPDLRVHDPDLGVHDPDLAVHDADLGVHHAPILLFTMGRSKRSRWTDARSLAKVGLLQSP
jgi:hypothetical protein